MGNAGRHIVSARCIHSLDAIAGAAQMTPARIRALGKAAFGKGWQTHLARALGVTPVAVSRWMNGHRKVAAHVAIAIRCVCEHDPTTPKLN